MEPNTSIRKSVQQGGSPDMSKRSTFKYESNVAYEQLVGNECPFESGTQLLIFAASVGFSRGEAVSDAPVDNPDGTDDNRESAQMRWNYIDDNPRLSVITASMTYADTGDPEAILSDDKQIETLVQYGAAGSRILYEEVLTASGDDLDNLVDFIQDYRNDARVKRQTGVLEELEGDISTL